MDATQVIRKTKARGRIETGQEAVIKLDRLRGKVDALVTLYTAAREASTDLSEEIKQVAEASGLLAKVVRSYVAARASEKFPEKRREVEQLSLVFEDLKW